LVVGIIVVICIVVSIVVYRRYVANYLLLSIIYTCLHKFTSSIYYCKRKHFWNAQKYTIGSKQIL